MRCNTLNNIIHTRKKSPKINNLKATKIQKQIHFLKSLPKTKIHLKTLFNTFPVLVDFLIFFFFRTTFFFPFWLAPFCAFLLDDDGNDVAACGEGVREGVECELKVTGPRLIATLITAAPSVFGSSTTTGVVVVVVLDFFNTPVVEGDGDGDGGGGVVVRVEVETGGNIKFLNRQSGPYNTPPNDFVRRGSRARIRSAAPPGLPHSSSTHSGGEPAHPIGFFVGLPHTSYSVIFVRLLPPTLVTPLLGVIGGLSVKEDAEGEGLLLLLLPLLLLRLAKLLLPPLIEDDGVGPGVGEDGDR